jgi:hypothetical protein
LNAHCICTFKHGCDACLPHWMDPDEGCIECEEGYMRTDNGTDCVPIVEESDSSVAAPNCSALSSQTACGPPYCRWCSLNQRCIIYENTCPRCSNFK